MVHPGSGFFLFGFRRLALFECAAPPIIFFAINCIGTLAKKLN
jgi:hypothetical protein